MVPMSCRFAAKSLQFQLEKLLLPSLTNQSSSLGPIMNSKAMSIKGMLDADLVGLGP